ncbi:helix-turn-helix transcriptional regulator [Streptomyces sp. HUAS TT20]|uniref:helix-turn-helix transcriptional regulator n=1 Tax=Streptomyces sp. HUAS TT20 TaxID=3447509 RepID=UPI0021D8F716|nr:helix-turn-helix domain-containing protein [Streptomyces sp. HUAS 15-9]UXY31972.1 helix-turn-helix domain-containing protein [Streptomyces sp. HUAS 15-9]
MSEQTLHDPTDPPTVGESRAHVLDVLRATPEAVGVREIAEQTGLHSNTARFHLDTLVKDGLAERSTEGRGRPGRPRTVYRAAASSSQVPAGRRSYQLLAQMLTGLVTEALPQPGQAAVNAGEAWGRYLADTPSPTQRIDTEEAIRRLTQVLADVGFAPGAVQDQPDPVIPLRHCPFREIAEEHRDVVCSLHLGLMRGALKEVRAPLGVDRLEPFVEPSLCLAHLTPAEQHRADRTA